MLTSGRRVPETEPMSLMRRRTLVAAWGGAVLLLLVPPVSAQAPPLSFEALAEGDIPARGLSDRLDRCLEEAEARDEEREAAESARRDRLREEQAAAALARTNEILERLARDPKAEVAPALLEEMGQEIEAMFPSSGELRLETCQVLHERARRRLEIAAQLESCYRTAFADLGVGHLAPPEADAVAGARAEAIRRFSCSPEILPMKAEVELGPGETTVLTASTVCLEADLPRPRDGETYAVGPDAVAPEVLDLLRAAAADPALLADVQEAVWSGRGRAMVAGSGRGVAPGRSAPLADAVAEERVRVVATIHDGFSLVDLVLSNPTPDPVTVTLTGTRLEPRGGGGGSQSLGMAGAIPGSPPRAPSLEPRDERLARALRLARERLENAIERVRNGDHSPEALRELLEALREAEALGLDGDEAGEALQEEGFDALVDGAYERAEESYAVWEHDPTDANRRQALEDFRAVEEVGGPSDEDWDDYGQKLEKLAGE